VGWKGYSCWLVVVGVKDDSGKVWKISRQMQRGSSVQWFKPENYNGEHSSSSIWFEKCS
jgi:hypothetical protein